MRKTPSLFKRDYDGNRQVYDEVVPGSEWVQNGEGIATLKLDGTSCLVKNGVLYKRYDRKPSRKLTQMTHVDGQEPAEQWLYKPAPDGWEAAQEADEVTGHWPGWMPVLEDAPEDQWHREAWEHWFEDDVDKHGEGTYELLGPKVQGNPYGYSRHALVRHGAIVIQPEPPRTFAELKEWFADNCCEGIVWHHPDGRMVKIKRKDFGLAWPAKNAVSYGEKTNEVFEVHFSTTAGDVSVDADAEMP